MRTDQWTVIPLQELQNENLPWQVFDSGPAGTLHAHESILPNHIPFSHCPSGKTEVQRNTWNQAPPPAPIK